MDPPPDGSYVDSVVRYYDRTWFDYRLVWVRHRNYMGMHWGYWDAKTRSHSESLLNMNRAVAARADLQPGMKVLDAGCGNGGTAAWIAETHDVHVVGVTLSAAQAEWGAARMEREGLSGQVRILHSDYRDAPGEGYDAVSSIGLMEHVGPKNHRAYMEQAARCLAPGGIAFIHTIGEHAATGATASRRAGC